MSTEIITSRDQLPEPDLVEAAPGVFAYVQHDGSWCLNNPAFIAAAEGVVAIDACATERRTRGFREAIGRISEQPVRTLINTHAHLDHTFGNHIFKPEATIIGHGNTRAELLRDRAGMPERAKMMFPGVEWGQVDATPPDVTFEDEMAIYAGELELRLIYVSPAHTNTDIVAWLPQHRTLITGDIIFNLGTPFALMGSIAGWLDALDQLRALGAETIIPGHGPVCGPETFDEVADYLRFIQATAAEAFAAGAPSLEAARDADLGRFSEWHDSERIVGNLHRAYSELRGEPRGAEIDTGKAFAEMLEYNGGQPLRCLA